MEIFRGFCVILLMISFVSCSTMKDSVSLGMATGAATGLGAGAIASKNKKTKGMLIGAGVGAAVGGLSSYIIHKLLGKRDNKVRKDTLFNLEKYNVESSIKDFTNHDEIFYKLTDDGNLVPYKVDQKVAQ